MAPLDNLLEFYLRQLTNIDVATAAVNGVSIAIGFLCLITMGLVLPLAVLVHKARPGHDTNRFIALMLMTESIKLVALAFQLAFPFGLVSITVIEGLRAVTYGTTLLSVFLYLAAPLYFLSDPGAVVSKVKTHALWLLPLATLLIFWLIHQQSGGLVETIGGVLLIHCEAAGVPPIVDAYPGTKVGVFKLCPEVNAPTYPTRYYMMGSSPFVKNLLMAPAFGALFALACIRRIQKRIKPHASQEQLLELRSVFIGFSGKALFHGSTAGAIIVGTIIFGQLDVANAFDYLGDIKKLALYFVLIEIFLFGICAATLFEGVMFTYAVVKNQVLGIDEKIRRTFTTATFGGMMAVFFLVASELAEELIGIGWVGGVLIGVPGIVLRKPILARLSVLSRRLMPVTEGGAEQRYYDAFAMVMADGLVSNKERLLLNGQADALGLSPADIERIERRYHDKDSDPAPASEP